jgi:fermentation-respiration switch protein FrsA (DUF1100 family)
MPQADARATVMYFHGNGGNLSVWLEILAPLHARGLSVLAFDYRGYGVSTGRPSEAGLYRDVNAVLKAIGERGLRSRRPVIYWGRSLGTVLAGYAASREAPDGLILEAGFPDLATFLRSHSILSALRPFASYRFPTAEFLASVDVPTLVLHGDRDGIIPFACGEALHARLATSRKRFVRIAGGDHNDPVPADPAAYWEAVDRLVGDAGAARR